MVKTSIAVLGIDIETFHCFAKCVGFLEVIVLHGILNDALMNKLESISLQTFDKHINLLPLRIRVTTFFEFHECILQEIHILVKHEIL
jgi:hypothetical protein